MIRLPRAAAALLAAGFVVVLATAAVSCSVGGETTVARRDAGGGAQTAVPVTTAPVVQKPMALTIGAVGTAEAYSTVSVHAQITGELTSVNFADGDDVTKGQVLFTLDRRPLESTLDQMQANLQRDMAQAANARAQTDRYQDLARRGIATREQLDQQQTNAAALEATVAADRAAVEAAKVQLTYATISAPIAGRTGKLMVHAGNLVRANDATPLVVINQISPIHVSFGIPESQLPEFSRNLNQRAIQVEASPPNDTGRPSRGRVSFVDNAVDHTTGTIEVRGTFPNEDRRLWPGQFVNVTVTLGTEATAIVVPTVAVQTGQQGQYVFVAKPDSTVELRSVQIARSAGAETVVKSGLTPGEMVVTDGQLRLVPGTHIAIRTGGAVEKSQ
jgi:multidrug efflux system membrane fusion protein